jgi:cytoskeleton protein RodZ
MAAGQGSEKAVSSGGDSKTESGGGELSAEAAKSGAENEVGLGKMLAAAREKRGLSRADVVAETRIPGHYLKMIESSDYRLISDQLYLLPFVRRYSAFLGLDSEEVAMRFVREVQRADGAPPARMSERLMLADGKRSHWGRLAAAAAVLVAVVVLYFLTARRYRASFQPHHAAIPASHAQSAAPQPMAAMPRVAAPLKAPDTSVVANSSAAPAEPRTDARMRTAPSERAAPGTSSAESSGQPAAARR